MAIGAIDTNAIDTNITGTDAIETKKKETEKPKPVPKENNWKTFGYSCIFSLFIAALTWLIASNIVFFTRLPTELLNKIFPKDPTKPPYAPDEDFTRKQKCTRKIPKVELNGTEYTAWNAAKHIQITKSDETAPPSPLGDAMQLAAASNPMAKAALSALPPGATDAMAKTAMGALSHGPTGALAKEAMNVMAKSPEAKAALGALQKGGGLKDDIMNKLQDNTPKFRWPYTMMNPFSDCVITADTITDFYMSEDLKDDKIPGKNKVYTDDGKLVDRDRHDYYEKWSEYMSKKAKEISTKIKEQKHEISTGKKNQVSPKNMEAMKENLKSIEKIQKYFKPTFFSGQYWKQFFHNIGNWLGSSTQYAFVKERTLLQWIFEKLGKIVKKTSDNSTDLADQHPNNYLFGLIGIITNMVISYLIIHFTMISGTVLNIWGQISGSKYTDYDEETGELSSTSNWKKGLIYSFIGGCLGMMNFMYAFGVGVIQYIEIIYKFIMYPILSHFDMWKENCRKTVKYLPIFYGMLLTTAAWASLEPIYGNVMGITLFAYILKANSNNNAAIKKAKEETKL